MRLASSLGRVPAARAGERRRITAVRNDTRAALARIASADVDSLADLLVLEDADSEGAELDARTTYLVRVAVLIALDAPPASYAWQLANAIAAGASAEDILGVLRAVAPQVGWPKAVAAAPEIMLALGLPLSDAETES
jgi:alkylhydroperoxidase/carboxymuconolactone decarboxylase family protein YurZ